jgi:hypothetical protein
VDNGRTIAATASINITFIDFIWISVVCLLFGWFLPSPRDEEMDIAILRVKDCPGAQTTLAEANASMGDMCAKMSESKEHVKYIN